MSAIKVKPNHFFKKQTVTTGLSVNPKFPDLGTGTLPTFTLAGVGPDTNAFVLSGTVAEQPSYGDGELVSGVLRLYPSEATYKYNRNVPKLFGYALDKDYDIKEGAYTLANISGNTNYDKVGQHLGVYGIHPYSSVPQISEEFEGSPEELETVTRMGGSNLTSLSDPYVTEETLMAMLAAEGHSNDDARIDHLRIILQPVRENGRYLTKPRQVQKVQASRTGDITSEYTETVYGGLSDVDEAGPLTYNVEFIGGNVNRIKFKSRGHKQKGLSFLVRLQDQTARSFAKRNHDVIPGTIKYRNRVVAANNLEGDPQATKGNTILSDFYATRNFSNPFDSSDSNPLITTDISLTSEKSVNNGQSLRIYHNWGFAGPPNGSKNIIIQNQIQESGNLNPQCARVSLYDIPYPSIATDLGGSRFSENTPNLGDARSVVPEIHMSMNISKLEPNIHLNVQEGTSGPYLSEPVTLLAEPGTPADRTGSSASNFSNRENSFLRSVVVTFSNYKPKKEHTSLDKFLAYGLNNFYTSGTSENIVGGVIFTRFGIDGADVGGAGNNMFAYPLPVMKIAQMDVGTPSTSEFTLARGGMAQIRGGTGRIANCDSVVWGAPAAPKNATVSTAVSDEELQYCNLPMNTWFNMRCFIDIFQHNNSGSCLRRPMAASVSPNLTAAQGSRGVPMRIIFETDDDNELQTLWTGAPAAVDGGSRVDKDTRNLPFLDIFFPAADSSAHASMRDYTFYSRPEYYPKHMTVWVQNYCWVSGSSSDATIPYEFGEQNVYASGAAREAEVYIDNIQLYNFEPTVKNVTTDDSLQFQTSSHLSPLQKIYSSSGPYYGSSWVSGEPQVITGSLTFTTGDATVTIPDNEDFDTTFLDNHGTVTITSTAFAGSKTISSITDRLTFQLNNNTGITSTTDPSAVLSCAGTLDPPTNRANLKQYDTGMHMAIGFDSPDHLPQVATGSAEAGLTGYILGNDYVTYGWDEASENPLYPNKATNQPSNASGAIFSQQLDSTATDGSNPPANYEYVMGGDFLISTGGVVQQHTAFTNNVSGAAFQVYNGTTATVGDDMINLGISTGGSFASTNDFFSLDGLRQKGFFYVNLKGSGSTTPTAGNLYPRERWGRREHVGLSTKITAIADTDPTLKSNQIKVQDTNIFNFDNPNERYVVYVMGHSGTAGTTGTIQKGRKGNLKLARAPEGNVLTFTQELNKASDAFTKLFEDSKLNRLYISPFKYYLTMMFDTDASVSQRSYASFCTVNQTPSLAGDAASISGTTFNESQYNYNSSNFGAGKGGQSALYENMWNLIPAEGNTTLMTTIDSGYGSFDEATGMGGQFIEGKINVNNYNYYALSALTTNYKAGDNVPMVLYLGDTETDTKANTVTFFSDDYSTDTTKVPQIYWAFRDAPPTLSDLSCKPAINVVSGNVDLYSLTTENLNAIRFNWSEENAEDVWYRYMIVDSKPINDKYHACSMRLPLNETVSDFSSAPSYTVYNPTVGVSTAATVGSDVRAVIEGQGGYAPVLSTTTNGKITIPYATNYVGLNEKTEFSLVVHYTPSVADKGNKRYLITQMSSTGYPEPTTNDFFLYKDTDNTIKCNMGDSVALASVSSVICDGSTPTSIIVTFNSGSKHPNKANLYLDGTWQDGSTGTTIVDGEEDFIVGGLYAASTYTGSTGMFEEILIYDKELCVVNDGSEYILPTDNYPDFTNAAVNNSTNEENITYNARMFAADYHNFRGFNKKLMAMTNQTSWRTTTV